MKIFLQIKHRSRQFITALINFSPLPVLVFIASTYIYEKSNTQSSTSFLIFTVLAEIAFILLPFAGWWLFKRLYDFRLAHFPVYTFFSLTALFLTVSHSSVLDLLFLDDVASYRESIIGVWLAESIILAPLIYGLVRLFRGKLVLRHLLARFASFVVVGAGLLIVLMLGNITAEAIWVPRLKTFDIDDPVAKNIVLHAPSLEISSQLETVVRCRSQKEAIPMSERFLAWFYSGLVIRSIKHMALYENEKCAVILINPTHEISQEEDFQKRAIIVEYLIRRHFGEYMMRHENISPAKNAYLIDPESNPEYSRRVAGFFSRTSGSIWAFRRGPEAWRSAPLDVLIHEELHAFSSPLFIAPITGHQLSGLNEGVTEYLSQDIVGTFLGGSAYYSGYGMQIEAFTMLLPYLDYDQLLLAYFNGRIADLAPNVDELLYPGAFCSFNEYIDASLTAQTEQKKTTEAREFVRLATKALKDKSFRVISSKCQY